MILIQNQKEEDEAQELILHQRNSLEQDLRSKQVKSQLEYQQVTNFYFNSPFLLYRQTQVPTSSASSRNPNPKTSFSSLPSNSKSANNSSSATTSSQWNHTNWNPTRNRIWSFRTTRLRSAPTAIIGCICLLLISLICSWRFSIRFRRGTRIIEIILI